MHDASPNGNADRRVCVVFGGTGFLGRAVVRALRDAGHTVRVASRRAPHAAEPGIEHVRADVRDDDAVARAVRGAARVVNAVSLYVERGGATFDAIHVDGAARVARHARAAGAESLVHVSGLGTDPASPSGYVRARAHGETAVRDAFGSPAVLRPSVMFGRGDSFLTTLVMLTRLPVVPLFGGGETRLQPAYVADVAAAAVAAAGPETARGIYELGGAETLSYADAVRLVMRRLGRRRPLVAVPFGAWRTIARLLAVLPSPPLTLDQVLLMQADNVVGGSEPTFADLGISPRALSPLLPRFV